MVNDKRVEVEESEASETTRGLHIVVINPENGNIERAQCFDTYKSSKDLESFIAAGVPEGKIVAAACEDECSKKLSRKAR